MANLQVKNLPEDLHEELRRRAKLAGRTVRDYVIELIRRDQEFPTMQEWLGRIRELEPVELDRRAYDLIEEDHAERDRQFLNRWSEREGA